MRVLDLFSGVGMFAYGMERAGHEVVAFCEIEEWPRRVLNKHWPGVPVYEDVRELSYERLREDGVVADAPRKLLNGSGNAGPPRRHESTDGGIDIITAGFPCQDLSVAGKQAGIRGERSGLFDEIVRIAGEVGPRYIILENVAALLTGDSGGWARHVFGELAALGFDAEWHVIPAGGAQGLSAGAPHRRERVWVVAYASGPRLQGDAAPRILSGGEVTNGHGGPSSTRLGRWQPERPTQSRLGLLADGIAARLARSGWLPEPGIGRVATGVPDRVKKLKALGNGLVWQIPYAIGCAINDQENAVRHRYSLAGARGLRTLGGG